MSGQFCFKWNSHLHAISELKDFLSTEAMVDVTLVCDGRSLKAHKIVLSAFSPFFKSLFSENSCKHPIVILKDMKYIELKIIIDFMYCGEVNIAEDQLSAVIKTAQILKVKGLGEVEFVNNESNGESENQSADGPENLTCNESESQSNDKFDFRTNSQMNVMNEFKNFLTTGAMVDVTLGCDGKSLKAHKIVLSAYSSLFKSLFLENPCKHPIVILKDMKYTELKSIINFMYSSEVKIPDNQLSTLIKTAQTLRVKILAETDSQNCPISNESGNLIADESGSLIGEESGNLIGNESGSLIGEESGNLIGNESGSLIGEESGNLIDDESGSLIGEESGNLIGEESGNLIGEESGNLIGEKSGTLIGDASENQSDNESETLIGDEFENQSGDESGTLVDGESENQSRDELPIQPAFMLGDNSNWTVMPKQSSSYQDENGGYVTKIKQENVSDDTTISVSYKNTATSVPLQYHNTNPLLRQILSRNNLFQLSRQPLESQEFTGASSFVPISIDSLLVGSREPRSFSGSASVNNNQTSSQNVIPCGCRNNCMSRFTETERQLLATHHKSMKPKKKQELYFLSLITINKVSKRTYDGLQKHIEYKYTYKVRIGRKVVDVCVIGFMLLHNINMSMLNDLHEVLKMGKYDQRALAKVVYPYVGDLDQEESGDQYTNDADSDETLSLASGSFDTTNNNNMNVSVKIEDDEMNKRLTTKVPAIEIERIASTEVDTSEIDPPEVPLAQKKKKTSNKKKVKGPVTKKDINKNPATKKTSNKVSATNKYSTNKNPATKKTSNKVSATKKYSYKDLATKKTTNKVYATKKYSNKDPVTKKASNKVYATKKYSYKDLETKKTSNKELSTKKTSNKDLATKKTSNDVYNAKKDSNVRKRLRDIPQVVKSLNEVEETLLIDLHFLLFSSIADSGKVKENILNFDGFKFSADSEEYDERKDFLERMTGKLLQDVARAFAIGAMCKRERNIENILAFLLNPGESHFRASDVATKKDSSKSPPAKKDSSKDPGIKKDDNKDLAITEEHNARKKLKDFPLVVQSLDETSDSVLKELHNLLFSRSNWKQSRRKVKDRILEFDGYKFFEDTEEYDEKNEILLGMSSKRLADVAKALSLFVFTKREKNVQNILDFLMDPDESYLSGPDPDVKEDSDEDPETKKDSDTTLTLNMDGIVRKKLRDFPLVVKSLDEVAETLLIDLHYLLFSSSANSDEIKDNILNFDGFNFSTNSEEYDERKDFLQRMSGKLLTDVSRAFSVGVMNNRERTIHKILCFLLRPHESYLKASVSPLVILSDAEQDDMEGFSSSDESCDITCEVLEKKVECIDLVL